ncbi:hypothetical protein IEQ34_011820 [Dendrobium chrysotoxum]|uniref:Nodulin-like domain-containing protein n=1 Tax=Dendrobium chrysotoxum TaxID=161865 RepID=A0AAV7GSM8_DENCH|nr:hypothetical protein IEQ34_011820 [Dendrobium chrysotoxum]
MAVAGGPLYLTTRVIQGRWFMVYACFIIMSAAGATYIFSIYSPVLKSSLHYNQQTLNTLSFFKDLGANVGIISGLINEVTPPFVVLLLGAAMNLFGYLMIYLAIISRITRPPVWQMCLFICVGANSQTFANTGALVTCVKNFPESRGIVLGLLKCFVGLSGAILTQLYPAFYGDDSKSLVLLIAWLPAAVSIFFVYTIRIMKPPRGSETVKTRPFYYFLYLTVALSGYLLVFIVLEKVTNFNRAEYIANGAVVIFLLFLPIVVVINEELNILKKQSNQLEQCETKPPTPVIAVTVNESSNTSVETSIEDKLPKTTALASITEMFRPPARGEDYTILQALFSIDMIVLFLATICGVGGTLTAIDNMGQIGQSLGYPSKSISTFVSLVSIWNAMGRLAAGFLSEILLKKYNFSRPLMLTFVLLLACAGHLLIAFGVPNSLYIASVIIGFCFGAQWPLLFAIISEVFGLKYYSTLYNLGGVASPIGSYILNVRVTGRLYDREAARQNKAVVAGDVKDLTCIGVKCFQLSFLIITAATVVGAMVSLLLVVRTRNFYKGDIYAKFRETTAELALAPPQNGEKKFAGGEGRIDGVEEVVFLDTVEGGIEKDGIVEGSK